MPSHVDFCITATLSAILIAPGLSAAKDFCLDASEGGAPTENNPIVIGRAFKTPKRNRPESTSREVIR